MPHYKDAQSKLHFLDDESFAHLLPAGCVQITDDEADALLPLPEVEPEKVKVKRQILEIERDTMMNRAVREFMLLSAEAQAAAQGITPEQLYAANPAYKSVKDVDSQVTELRKKLK